LRTGGGLAMPWTGQPSAWWLDAQPASGSQSAHIRVRPTSTQLGEGVHEAELRFAATPTGRRVAVTYVIRKSTGVNQTPASESFTLEAWPQPVPGGTDLHVRIGGRPGERCRVTLHDLLGRARISREVEAGRSVSLDLASASLPAGVYLLRAVAGDGAQVSRMVSVVW
ncbi:MAG: T9SS type A sorting domain-containing protein, partial [Bacteroidota bacterium]|nr:T9SS type A sorting domain-containing protein [Bacteroidota bacterium]